MMFKLLVGLSLITTICGNAINLQNNVDPLQPTNCENSEVLLKVWTILSDLLGPDGKSVKVPDSTQIKYALTLIKKSLQETPAINLETSMKLQRLENELAQNNDIILNDKRPLRSLLEVNPIKNDLSSNMLFRYDLPSSIKPSCKAAFLNLIDLAQETYVNMAKSPVCTDANAEPLVPNTGGVAYYIPTGGLYQNPYYSALLSPREEALKKVTEYLKAPDNRNLNNVITLLQSFQPKVPYVNPLNFELHPYTKPQSKDALSYNQYNNPTNTPDSNRNHIDAKNRYSPFQGDFSVNLEHAKDIAKKFNAQNLYNYLNPDANNRIESNDQKTPTDVFYLPNSGSVLNNSPNKQIPQAELQKMYKIPIKNGNNDNVNNPQQSMNNLYQAPPFGYAYLNPYVNPAKIALNDKLKALGYHNNNGVDNFINNYYYPKELNNPSDVNGNIYQNILPNGKNPINVPWEAKQNNNLGLDKQPHDASGVANGPKSETNVRAKGQVELTYLLKRKRPLIYQPFYFVKYRLPYNYFVENLRHMLSLEPDLSTPPTELYKGLIAPSNATEVSPDLASYPKEEVHNLVLKDGALVKAIYIEPNVTDGNYKTNPARDSSEVLFEGDFEHSTEKSKNNGGLIPHQNEHNNAVSKAPELNLPALNDIVRDRAALYHNLYPLRQDNQSLAQILAALSLQNMLVKDPNVAVPNQNTLQNQAPSSEIPLHNIENQRPVSDPIFSPYKEIQQAPSSPPYLTDSQFGQRNPYAIENQAALTQKPPSYMDTNPEHQYFRPPYLGISPYHGVSQAEPIFNPYVIGAQAALGYNNKFSGNSLTNNLYKFRESRRLLGGYLNQNPYGYDRPVLYPNGGGSPYQGVLGNQGLMGQPVLGNQLGNGLGTLGIGQPSLYAQPPYFG